MTTSLTPFQTSVLLEIAKIPFGQTRTYGEIASAIGKPRAVRAVGSACGKNPFPFVVPCHRVVRSGGEIGNYSAGGTIVKKSLLEFEKQLAS